jgi:tetratricopeptide (TPR) repeat protein
MTFDVPGASAPVDFQAGFADDFGAPEAGPAENTSARVDALLEQGQRDFDRGDFQGAIDTWSRIYLIDVSNAEADRRIEQARRRREEVERQAEQHFYEAKEAFDQKRFDDARSLCQQVLRLIPQHLEAHDLLQRLETPAAPPPPASNLAAEEDLFRDEFVPATISSSSGSVPAVRSAATATRGMAPPEAGEAAEASVAARPTSRARTTSLPLTWIGVGLGVLLLVGAGAFLLRGKVFSGGKAAATEAIAESEQLAKQGRLQEAIQVLQSLQGGVEGEAANRVNQRVLEYQRRLKASTAPKPVANGQVVMDALAAGRRVKAMALVREGLAKAPGDAELTRLQSEITSYDGAISALSDAVAAKNWESIRSLTDQMLKNHPEDAESLRLWSVATFNVAVLHLRKYQVAEGHELLVELSKRVSDPDADRLQQLAKSYLSRPVDPRYQIFVSNVDLRQVD